MSCCWWVTGMRLCLFPASPSSQPGRFKAASYLDSICALAPAAWLPQRGQKCSLGAQTGAQPCTGQECRQSTLGLRWCFLSTSSLPTKIRLSSSSCPSPAFLSFYSRLRQFFVKGGVGFFFFAQIFNLLQSALLHNLSAPNCSVCFSW